MRAPPSSFTTLAMLLLHNICRNDALFYKLLFGRHGKSKVYDNHAHITGREVLLGRGASDDHFVQSGVSNGEAGHDRTMVEVVNKHCTVGCHVCGGVQLTP